MEDQHRKQLENCVLDIMSTLREAKITVEDFQGEESQKTLFNLINENGLVGKFKQLDALVSDSNGFDPEIPIRILDFIDHGYNPDLYIKDMRKTGIEETELVKSKMSSLELFSQILESQIAESWPEQDKQ